MKNGHQSFFMPPNLDGPVDFSRGAGAAVFGGGAAGAALPLGVLFALGLALAFALGSGLRPPGDFDLEGGSVMPSLTALGGVSWESCSPRGCNRHG